MESCLEQGGEFAPPRDSVAVGAPARVCRQIVDPFDLCLGLAHHCGESLPFVLAGDGDSDPVAPLTLEGLVGGGREGG